MSDQESEIERIVRAKKAREKQAKEAEDKEAARAAHEKLSTRERWKPVREGLLQAIIDANKALERSDANAKFHWQENPQPGDGAVGRGTLSLQSYSGSGTRFVASIIGMGDAHVLIDATSPVHVRPGLAHEYKPNFSDATSDFWTNLLTDAVRKCL